MNIDVELSKAERIIRRANPTATLRFTASQDWSCEDHEATLWLDGKPTNIHIQIGFGYLCVNRWVESAGTMYHHYDGPTWRAAAHTIGALVAQGMAA